MVLTGLCLYMLTYKVLLDRPFEIFVTVNLAKFCRSGAIRVLGIRQWEMLLLEWPIFVQGEYTKQVVSPLNFLKSSLNLSTSALSSLCISPKLISRCLCCVKFFFSRRFHSCVNESDNFNPLFIRSEQLNTGRSNSKH